MTESKCKHCARYFATSTKELGESLMAEHLLDRHPELIPPTKNWSDSITLEDMRLLRDMGIAVWR